MTKQLDSANRFVLNISLIILGAIIRGRKSCREQWYVWYLEREGEKEKEKERDERCIVGI